MASLLELIAGEQGSVDPEGTLAALIRMTPHEVLMQELAATPALPARGSLPQLRPALAANDPGEMLRADVRERQAGTQAALGNIPISPLAGAVAAAAPSVYDAMTAPVEGANPEAPNMLASLDNLSLGGLIDSNMAYGLLRAGQEKGFKAPARVRPGHEREFNEWFGGSRVVDEKGNPLEVYHGTRAGFDAFDLNKLGENADHPSAHMGFYFAKDPALASDFAKREDGRVMPVHLKMENPYEMSAKEFAEDLDFWQGFKAVRRSDGTVRPADDRYRSSRDHFIGLQEWATENGYDGFIIKGDPEMAREYPELAHDNFVVFDPEQIKSATGNRGTYSPSEPDIRK